MAQGLAQKYVNLLLVLLLLLSMYPVFPRAGAYTTSPSFPQQEIIDQTRDWIDLTNKKLTSSGDRYTDIVSVDYFSDGKILNSTLWLLLPFKERPIRENVNFGMYIDADFNSKTGYGGIDYQIEIRWNNDTQQWSKVTESWSHYGDTRVLENISNYSGFYERGGKYVVLSADLTKLFHPQKYKVLFYAEVKKNDSTKTDFTRWVAIPPLQLIVSTSPGTVEITKGEQKTIEVKVNSTQGYEPTVNIYTINGSKEISFNFTYNRLRIPSYGMSTTPMTIAASKNALSGPYTLFIFANSTFPSEQLIKPKTDLSSSDVRSSQPTENILTQTSILVNVQDPPSFLDQIGSGWEKLGGPISFLYGIIAGISPWLFGQIKKFVSKGKK